MKRPFTVFRCDGCGRAAFPRRLMCGRCGGSEWTEVAAGEGVVEEVTTREHRTYEEKRNLIGGWVERESVPLASVRTDAGPVVTARAEAGLAPGARVRVYASSGAPVVEGVEAKG